MTTNYKKIYDTLAKERKSRQGSSSTTSSSSKLQKTIDNKKARLLAAGVDANKALDDRNAIEKLLNLKQKQGLIGDFFEVLNRPQQALFGGINSLQNGESFGKGMSEGITGNKDTNFKNILTDAGMSDRKGKLDLVDVLGFVGDVVLDPADLALFPVATASKATKAISKVDDVVDAAKAVSKADKALDVAKTVDKVADVAEDTYQMKSLTDLAFGAVGKGIKGTAKVSDNLLEKGLGKIDELNGITYKYKGAKSAANLGKEFTQEATGKLGKLELYKGLKDEFKRAFDYAYSVPGKVRDAVKGNTTLENILNMKLSTIPKEYESHLENYAKAIGGKNADEIADIMKKADLDIADYKEYKNLNRTVKGKDLIEEALGGTLTELDAGKDGIDFLNRVVDNYNSSVKGTGRDLLTYEISKDKIKLNNPKDWSAALKGSVEDGAKLDPEILKEKITKSGNYRKADIDRLESIGARLSGTSAEDKAFQELYRKSDDIFNRMNKVVNDTMGTNLKTTASNAGYVRHGYNKNTIEALKSKNLKGAEYGDILFKGNSKTLSDRKYNMSILEANNIFNDELTRSIDDLDSVGKAYLQEALGPNDDLLFRAGMRNSINDYIENIPKLAKDAKNIDAVLVDHTFGSYQELKKVNSELRKAHRNGDNKLVDTLRKQKTELMNNSSIKIVNNASEVPRGFTQLNEAETNKLMGKLRNIGEQLGIKDMNKVAKGLQGKSGKIAINDEVLRLIEIQTDTKNVNAFVQLYDKYMNLFKGAKITSPQFILNNLTGNTSNIWLSGMSVPTMSKRFPEAIETFTKGQDLLYKKQTGEVLSAAEKKIADIWEEFTKVGFGDSNVLTAMQINDMPEVLQKMFKENRVPKGKDIITQGIPYIMNKANNYMDNVSRLAIFIEGLENPKYLKGLGVANAGDAVRKVMFDPGELTQFEKDVMKRVVPFYTFTKKNLAYQISNLSQNGKKYHQLMKARDNLLDNATGDNSENVANFIKDNMYIPIPGIGKDGEYTLLRAQLPFGNLIDMTADPLGGTINLLTPAIKAPFESLTNKNFFNNSDIEKFSGQKSTSIPFLTKKQEHFLSNATGLDVPVKSAVRAFQGLNDTMQGNAGPLEAISRMTTMTNNIDSDKLSRQYEEIDKLEDIIKQYKQRGYNISTTNELKKANTNSKISNINATLSKYNGIKNNPYSYTK